MPGVSSKSVTLPNTTEMRDLCCIGDEEFIVPGVRGGVFLIPTSPSIMIPMTLNLSDCQVRYVLLCYCIVMLLYFYVVLFLCCSIVMLLYCYVIVLLCYCIVMLLYFYVILFLCCYVVLLSYCYIVIFLCYSSYL